MFKTIQERFENEGCLGTRLGECALLLLLLQLLRYAYGRYIYIYILYIYTLLYRALCMRSATARAKVMHQVRSNVGTPAAPLALPMDGAAEPPRRRRRLAYEAASSSTQRLSAPLQRSAPLSAAHAVEDRFN